MIDELQLKLCDIQGRLFELSAEKVDVGKITHFRNLSYTVPTKPKQLTRVINFKLNNVFFRR